MSWMMDYDTFVEYLKTEEGISVVSDVVWNSSPRDYEWNPPRIESSRCTRTLEEVGIITNQFQYCHGALEDFRRRFALFQAERGLNMDIRIKSVEEIPVRIKDRAVKEDLSQKDLDDLMFDVIEKLRIPEIPALFLNLSFPMHFPLDRTLKSVISSFPTLYEYCLYPDDVEASCMRNEVSSNTARHLKKAAEMVGVILVRLKEEEREADKWFQEWSSSNPWQEG